MDRIHDFTNGCPDGEEVLAVLERRNVPFSRAGALLNHLSSCDECRSAAAFACAATAAEMRRSSAPGWNMVLSYVDPWANRADGDIPDALAASAPKRALTFASKPQDGESPSWRADVTLPAPDDPDGTLQISVCDADGRPLQGAFRFCGIECAVKKDGKSAISLNEFRRRHSFGGAEFAESGKPFTKGAPVIGSAF